MISFLLVSGKKPIETNLKIYLFFSAPLSIKSCYASAIFLRMMLAKMSPTNGDQKPVPKPISDKIFANLDLFDDECTQKLFAFFNRVCFLVLNYSQPKSMRLGFDPISRTNDTILKKKESPLNLS